jgi:hypothetical protein
MVSATGTTFGDNTSPGNGGDLESTFWAITLGGSAKSGAISQYISGDSI